MRTKLVVNMETGEQQLLPYTPEEEAAADVELAAWEAAQAALAAAIPSEVSPYQARVALLNQGLLDDVEAMMANEATPREAKIAWEYATTIRRESPFITALGPMLGLSDEQIDALFVAAAQVV